MISPLQLLPGVRNGEIIAVNLADGDFFTLCSEVHEIFGVTRLIEYFDIRGIAAA